MIRETSDWVGGVDGVGGVDVGRDVGIGRAERGHPRRTAGQHHDRIDLIDRSSRPDCQEIKGPTLYMAVETSQGSGVYVPAKKDASSGKLIPATSTMAFITNLSFKEIVYILSAMVIY